MRTNKFNMFIFVAVIVIVGGFLVFKEDFASSSPSGKPELRMDTLSYIDYSNASLETARHKGKPVLFFAATLWCQTCSELEKEILERQSEIPRDVTILKVDYDNDKAMNARWGVTSQHTLIVLNEKGEEAKRWIGGNFDAMIRNMNTI